VPHEYDLKEAGDLIARAADNIAPKAPLHVRASEILLGEMCNLSGRTPGFKVERDRLGRVWFFGFVDGPHVHLMISDDGSIRVVPSDGTPPKEITGLYYNGSWQPTDGAEDPTYLGTPGGPRPETKRRGGGGGAGDRVLGRKRQTTERMTAVEQ
jgi:hypothetical protein